MPCDYVYASHQAWRRTALAFESLAATLELEVPDTAATMRLSGLELADAIEEVSALSADITDGVRATGRSVAAVEKGIKNGTAMVSSGMTDYVFPAVKAQVPVLHGVFFPPPSPPTPHYACMATA